MNEQQRDELSRAFHRALGAQLRREKVVEDRAVVLPSQRGINYGSKWARYIPDERGCSWGHGCSHFHWGRVLTTKEYALGRLSANDTPEEIEDNIDRLHLRHLRGWRLSEVHCDAEGGGMELQSVPMAGVWPIHDLEYRLARQAHFIGRHIREESWFRHLFRRYRAETRREAQAAGLEPGEPLFVPKN